MVFFNLPIVFHKPRVQKFDEATRKIKASKSRNANFSEEKLLLAELEKQYPYMSAEKEKCHRLKKMLKPEMPMVTSAI